MYRDLSLNSKCEAFRRIAEVNLATDALDGELQKEIARSFDKARRQFKDTTPFYKSLPEFPVIQWYGLRALAFYAEYFDLSLAGMATLVNEGDPCSEEEAELLFEKYALFPKAKTPQ